MGNRAHEIGEWHPTPTGPPDAYGRLVIGVRLSGGDLGRIRFAHSPLVEVAESLWMLSSGRIQPLHRPWYEETRGKLRRVDLELLTAIVPARPALAGFLLPGASSPVTTIEEQLHRVSRLPAAELRRQVEVVWADVAVPPKARSLLDSGAAGPPRLAEALADYWTVALAPYWSQLRAVYDGDVAFRATALARSGVTALLADLHPQLSVSDDVLWIDKPGDHRQDLPAGGLLLVPSAFAWPNLIFEFGDSGTASLTYGVRGVANVWDGPDPVPADGDPLGDLIGRTRAAILASLAIPRSTTELALKLSVSPPSVSEHLSVLRRNGLVTSWRNGRSVLYRRTALATSVVAASNPSLTAGTAPGPVG